METKKIDKQIHADELKLRILMKDGCNQNCTFCLNDFQPKPKPGKEKFLNKDIAEKAIRQYVKSFKGKYPLQVYFSGGEPTLHPDLIDLMKLSKSLGCRVTLNTNGNFPDDLEDELKKNSDVIHVGTYGKSKKHADKIVRIGGLIQCIYPYIDSLLIEFYSRHGIPIKIFRDFYDTGDGYSDFVEKLVSDFPDAKLSFRHTGVQENRGPGCGECKKRCITLKAAWIFPDGSSSPCPQLFKHPKNYPKDSQEWSEYFNSVEAFHKKN